MNLYLWVIYLHIIYTYVYMYIQIYTYIYIIEYIFIQKTTIMASGPITSWQIDGETVETVTDFIFLGSKFTADGDYRHEVKRRLLLGRKAMTNLDSILKSRDAILSTSVHIVKAMVFPVVMYGCESWTMKKAECRRIDDLDCGVGEDSWESLGL